VKLLGYITTETAKAILFWDHFWHGPEWFPKSQVQIGREQNTDEVSIEPSAWIARQNGVREFEERKAAGSNVDGE
jgi:hypothetical protein